MTEIELHKWLTLMSCIATLGLATTALFRLSRGPLALPLALLSLDLFALNASDIGYNVTNAPQWLWLDAAAASLLCPTALYLVRVFVGETRTRWLLRGVVIYFGGVACVCALALLGIGWAQTFAGTRQWALTMLPGLLAGLIPIFVLLARHLRESAGRLERTRTWLVIGAFGLAVIGNVTDLAADTGMAVPRLGPLGNLLGVIVLAVVALRLGLFDRRLSRLVVAGTVVAGVLQVGAFLAVFHFLGSDGTVLAVAVGTLMLAMVPWIFAIRQANASVLQRLEYHAQMGRLSEQMAHDLRNPLAAIKGAAQFLQGADPKEAAEYLQLIVEQTERLERVIDSYKRLGRIEPALRELDFNALAGGLVSSQSLAAPPGITVRSTLWAERLICKADPDLLAAAVENLIRNAYEAMLKGGVLELVVGFSPANGGPARVTLKVSDTGKGMDARTSSRVFDDFFTTKATGTGLGLPFVKRVVEAHQGEISLRSDEGKGTTVQFWLPCER